MTYENMTAQELHDLVTRLAAHGFKLPEGLTYRNLPKPHSEHYKPYWAPSGTNYGYPAPFAAAIIEVAARDWWLRSDPNIEDGEGCRDLHICLAGVNAHGCHIGDLCDEIAATPLHAIVAAVEAKEAK